MRRGHGRMRCLAGVRGARPVQPQDCAPFGCAAGACKPGPLARASPKAAEPQPGTSLNLPDLIEASRETWPCGGRVPCRLCPWASFELHFQPFRRRKSAVPGTPHEVLLMALHDQPSLLAELVRHAAGVPLQGPLEILDTATRFSPSIEVRPDLLVRSPRQPWILFELQNTIDEKKRQSWVLAASVLCIREKGMGEARRSHGEPQRGRLGEARRAPAGRAGHAARTHPDRDLAGRPSGRSAARSCPPRAGALRGLGNATSARKAGAARRRAGDSPQRALAASVARARPKARPKASRNRCSPFSKRAASR